MAFANFAWIKSLRLWAPADYAVWILGGVAFAWIWLYRRMRRRALSLVASRLGLQFSPEMTSESMGIKDSSFYKAGDSFRNCMSGVINGRETAILDHRTFVHQDTVAEQTIAAFRVSADAYCRDRGTIKASPWHVEKIGEWIFVFQQSRLVKPPEIEKFLDEARHWF